MGGPFVQWGYQKAAKLQVCSSLRILNALRTLVVVSNQNHYSNCIAVAGRLLWAGILSNENALQKESNVSGFVVNAVAGKLLWAGLLPNEGIRRQQCYKYARA